MTSTFITAAGPVVTTQPAEGIVPHGVFVSGRVLAPGPADQTTLRLSFVGGNRVRISGLDRLPGRVNYLIGRDPRHWHTDIPAYARVVYRNVYPAVDLAYYGTHGRLEYDSVAHPGARLAAVALRVEGARRLSIDHVGNLHMDGFARSLVQDRPVIYQEVGGRRHGIAGRYVLAGGDRIAFHVGTYDRRRPLTIDPVLHLPLGGGGSAFGALSLGYAT